MRSGCVSYALRIGAAVMAALFLAGGALVLLLGAFSFGSSGGIRTVITVVAAMGAIYLFVRVGKDILRDLRGEEEKSPPSDRSG